ncbi:hypothetical protein DFJ74DRAFT_112692 [Hyaloraphidium curvatum]|nr:hypothetical protein DFJ74DRAFT_112692 [Hyaloraphidium curvatum]
MENDPLPDFEMHFYDGTRVLNSAGRKQLEIRLPDTMHVSAHGSGDASAHGSGDAPRSFTLNLDQFPVTVPQHLLPTFKHAQECLRQCMEIEKSSRMKDPGSFPIVVRSNRHGSKDDPSSAEPEAGARVSSDRPRSARGSFIIGETRSFETKLSVAPAKIPEAPLGDDVARRHVIEPTGHHSRRSDRLDRSGVESSVSSSTLVPGRDERNLARLPQGSGSDGGRIKFVEGIGWCLRSAGGNFQMLFNDGIQINVLPDQQVLHWIDELSQTQQR